MNPMHLVRMAKWVRRPPSLTRVKLVFGVIALALLIAGVEWMGWWPAWATAERMPKRF